MRNESKEMIQMRLSSLPMGKRNCLIRREISRSLIMSLEGEGRRKQIKLVFGRSAFFHLINRLRESKIKDKCMSFCCTAALHYKCRSDRLFPFQRRKVDLAHQGGNSPVDPSSEEGRSLISDGERETGICNA